MRELLVPHDVAAVAVPQAGAFSAEAIHGAAAERRELIAALATLFAVRRAKASAERRSLRR